MEFRKNVSGEGYPIPKICGVHSLDTRGDIEDAMKLYNLEGEEKESKVHQNIDLDLFQMEQD